MTDFQQVEALLRRDPVWSAYALADLEPPYAIHAHWFLRGETVVLVYGGLEPPVLFTQGLADDLPDLISRVPAGRYQFALLPDHRQKADAWMEVQREILMWRMVLPPGALRWNPAYDLAIRLGAEDTAQVRLLFEGQKDMPDAFLPEQLDSGPFYGIMANGQLAAIAGVHVVSSRFRIAAIGNVFTHPAWRGRGFAKAATAAVVRELQSAGISIIVLNVARSNPAAIRAYQALGFAAHGEYYEGVAYLGPAH